MISGHLLERGLNHLLLQSPGTSETLLRHAGCSVRFDLILAQFDFRIGGNGSFSEAAIDAPDAVIRLTPALIARLPFFGRDAWRFADYRGDPALLATLDRVFKQLDWDIEADLAPLVGDIAAHRLYASGRDICAGFSRTASALGRNASEHIVEEAEWVARAVDVARFNRDVDQLADDAARLDIKLRLFEAGAFGQRAGSRRA